MKSLVLLQSLIVAAFLVGCGGSESSRASDSTYIFNNIDSGDYYANSLIDDLSTVFSSYPNFKRKTFNNERHCDGHYGFSSKDLVGSPAGTLDYFKNYKMCHESDFSTGGSSIVISWDRIK